MMGATGMVTSTDSGMLSHTGTLGTDSRVIELERELFQDLQKIRERPTLRIARKIFSRTLHDYQTSKERSERLREIRQILERQAQSRQDVAMEELRDTIETLWDQYQHRPIRTFIAQDVNTDHFDGVWGDMHPQDSEQRSINVIHTVYLRQEKGR